MVGVVRKRVSTQEQDLPPEERFEADGRLAADNFSLDLADP